MSYVLLAPHNDDETLFASYLCLKHQPHVIVCLRSARMASPHYPGGMPISAETRQLETECAMARLECTWEQWPITDDYPQGWEDELTQRLHQIDADHIFAPAVELGGHQQHNVIGELARAIFGADRVQHYLTYTTEGRSANGTEVPFTLGWHDLKVQALRCYASQAIHPATRHWFEQEDLREYLQ